MVFHENYNAPIPLSHEEKKLPAAKQQELLSHPGRKKAFTVFTDRLLEADTMKRTAALERLNED